VGYYFIFLGVFFSSFLAFFFMDLSSCSESKGVAARVASIDIRARVRGVKQIRNEKEEFL